MALSLQSLQGEDWSSTAMQRLEARHRQEAKDKKMASVQEMKKTDMSTGTSRPIQQDTPQKDGLSAQMQDIGTQVKETVTEYYEQGRENLQDLNQTMEAQIRARPIQALLVAGGIGVLLGLLWLRR